MSCSHSRIDSLYHSTYLGQNEQNERDEKAGQNNSAATASLNSPSESKEKTCG